MSRQSLDDAVARRLGRRLRPEDSGRIAHLNAVDDGLVAEARKLGGALLQHAFLAYHVDSTSHRFLGAFIEDVIEGRTAASDWQRGRVLVPDWSLAEQLTIERLQLLAPVGIDFSLCVEPRVAGWRNAVGWVGAPALVQPDADYLSADRQPRHAAALAMQRCRPIESQAAAVRRWHAARLAAAAARQGDLGRVKSLAELAGLAGSHLPAPGHCRDDARRAAEALLRELSQPGLLTADTVPGFAGPRDWYEGDDDARP